MNYFLIYVVVSLITFISMICYNRYIDKVDTKFREFFALLLFSFIPFIPQIVFFLICCEEIDKMKMFDKIIIKGKK